MILLRKKLIKVCDQVFRFFFAEVAEVRVNPGLNDPRHKTRTIVTYYYESPLDAHNKNLTIGLVEF